MSNSVDLMAMERKMEEMENQIVMPTYVNFFKLSFVAIILTLSFASKGDLHNQTAQNFTKIGLRLFRTKVLPFSLQIRIQV